MHAISSILALAFVAYTQAHGGHDQQPIAPDADWATRHMAGEESRQQLNGVVVISQLTQHSRGAPHHLLRRRRLL